uniref:Chaperonin GroEL, chloroplastic n=1 Tax=Astrosyne radiata TaxID=1158023 RepID=A0A2U9NT73_9STRA|nr:chaperonin GroEL [Astrosyne radiata]AWT40340.1 chaperonin GroEL [Astrosyne radiata]|mmetsp:Transcript_15892/g.36520  ORF Transcript_15892/g.36520 Transcript_15892/m.36520 type:complete len:548 (+) Transcript_15892:95-1738(+)
MNRISKQTNKKILFKNIARSALKRGMDSVVEAVSITLGPKGRNVVIEKKNGFPQIVNDGVTIAKAIRLNDPIENIGISLIQQAAAKTNEVAGDGTTTATVLAYAIVKEGLQSIAAGVNPLRIKLGIEKAIQYLVSQLNEFSDSVEELDLLKQIATVSIGNDSLLGNLIAIAVTKIGKDGILLLEEGKNQAVELEISEGMKLETGFLSPYFVTNPEKMEVYYEDPFILLTDKKISIIQRDLLPILEQITKTKRPLLIIADNIEKEVLSTLILNKLKNIINVVVVRAPGFTETKKQLLEDIAIFTNGTVITDEAGLSLEHTTIGLLGQARKIIVNKKSTTIISYSSTVENIKMRCEQLRKEIILADAPYKKEKLQDRIAKLSGGTAIIRIGAVTETELKDKKLRVEDAVNASKAAIEEGVIPGGGSTLVHLSNNLKIWAKNNLKEDEVIGANIISRAILAPLQRISENAGTNGPVIIDEVQQQKFEIGYNAALNKFQNLYKQGIIDPTKVTRSALQNAASIASMILTTECLIVEEKNLKTSKEHYKTQS